MTGCTVWFVIEIMEDDVVCVPHQLPTVTLCDGKHNAIASTRAGALMTYKDVPCGKVRDNLPALALLSRRPMFGLRPWPWGPPPFLASDKAHRDRTFCDNVIAESLSTRQRDRLALRRPCSSPPPPCAPRSILGSILSLFVPDQCSLSPPTPTLGAHT